MGVALVNPRYTFTRLDTGAPLASGQVQVYVAGTTTPTNTWQNEALSSLNTNPINLDSAGAATIWTDPTITYKFEVRNSAGSVLYTVDNIKGAEPAGLRQALAASGGSAMIGFLQAGTGAVATTAQAKMREWVTPQDFGAVADGVTVDVVAIRRAFAASKTVRFPPGTYNFGDISANNVLVDLTALGTGITMICDAGAEFLCNTTDSSLTAFFLLELNSHFTVIGTARFRDTGYDPLITLKGAIGFLLTNYTGHSWGDVNIDAIYANSCVAPITVNGVVSATDRVRGINIGQVFCDNTYYGPNFQNQGDAVTIGQIYAYQVWRAYFVYGVTGHNVNVFCRNARASSGVVNISRSDGGLPTKAIKVRYVDRENVQISNDPRVLINHIGPSLGTISNIDIDFDGEEGAAISNYPVKFVTYTAPGGVETGAVLANVVDEIRIKGKYVPGAGDMPVTCTAAYTTPGRMHFESGPGLTFDSTIPAQFNLNNTTIYTPTWSCASGAAPAVGNGNISGFYTIDDDGMCQVSLQLAIGSTTTFGGGVWQFSTPFKAKAYALGSARIFRSGVAFYVGVSDIVVTTQQITVTADGGGAQIQAGVPFVWANGDVVFVTIQFPI